MLDSLDDKSLLQTLRSMEVPKVIAVGEQGCRVDGLAITVRLCCFSAGSTSLILSHW